jgi:hypothetical protein
MWFLCAIELEAAHAISDLGDRTPLHSLMLAGVAIVCAANLAWRGHRRTRSEYARNEATARLLRDRGRQWAADLNAAVEEVHALFRIREWGEE